MIVFLSTLGKGTSPSLDARLDARQDERQLPLAVTLAGRSDWHAACDNDATLCACALRVAASHVARLTELYGNIRSSAPIFRISDFKLVTNPSDSTVTRELNLVSSYYQEHFIERRAVLLQVK